MLLTCCIATGIDDQRCRTIVHHRQRGSFKDRHAVMLALPQTPASWQSGTRRGHLIHNSGRDCILRLSFLSKRVANFPPRMAVDRQSLRLAKCGDALEQNIDAHRSAAFFVPPVLQHQHRRHDLPKHDLDLCEHLPIFAFAGTDFFDAPIDRLRTSCKQHIAETPRGQALWKRQCFGRRYSYIQIKHLNARRHLAQEFRAAGLMQCHRGRRELSGQTPAAQLPGFAIKLCETRNPKRLPWLGQRCLLSLSCGLLRGLSRPFEKLAERIQEPGMAFRLHVSATLNCVHKRRKAIFFAD